MNDHNPIISVRRVAGFFEFGDLLKKTDNKAVIAIHL